MILLLETQLLHNTCNNCNYHYSWTFSRKIYMLILILPSILTKRRLWRTRVFNGIYYRVFEARYLNDKCVYVITLNWCVTEIVIMGTPLEDFLLCMKKAKFLADFALVSHGSCRRQLSSFKDKLTNIIRLQLTPRRRHCKSSN